MASQCTLTARTGREAALTASPAWRLCSRRLPPGSAPSLPRALSAVGGQRDRRRAVLLHYALFELRRALHAMAWTRHSSNVTPEENPKPPGAVRRVSCVQ